MGGPSQCLKGRGVFVPHLLPLIFLTSGALRTNPLSPGQGLWDRDLVPGLLSVYRCESFSPAGRSALSTKPSKWAYRAAGWMPGSCPLLGVFTCAQAVRVTERTGAVPTRATVPPHASQESTSPGQVVHTDFSCLPFSQQTSDTGDVVTLHPV